MRLSQRRANGIWFVDCVIAGTRRRLSTGARDRAAAEAAAPQRIEAAVRRHARLAESSPSVATKDARSVTLGDALAITWAAVWGSAKSSREMGHQIDLLKRELGKRRLSEIDYATLRKIGDAWIKGGTAPATVNRRISAVSRALTEMQNAGTLAIKPKMPHWREAATKERYLSDEEERLLLTEIDNRAAPAYPAWTYLASLIPLLLDTGLRLSEALNLAPDDVAESRVVLRHGTTKSDKGRSVPLTLRAQGAAVRLIANPLHGTLGSGAVSRRIAGLCNAVGLHDVTAHTFRHTCASRLVQRGVDLYHVKAWLGHASIVTTERYAHLRPDSLKLAAAVLEPRPRASAQA